MKSSTRTCGILAIALVGVGLLVPCPAIADTIWFDGASGGRPYRTFSDLTKAYSSFMGPGNTVIDFSVLAEGTKLDNQFKADFGVLFQNTSGGLYSPQSGVRPESGANVEDLTGYDGSYMPNGRPVYLKFNNDSPSTAFSILFDHPVAQVGAFLAVGKEGNIHSLTISAYDSETRLLGQKVVDTWLWDSVTARQNFESFFALRTDAPLISRVEILNNSHTDFSNALVVDNVAFSQAVTGMVPEPGVLIMVLCGALALRPRRHQR